MTLALLIGHKVKDWTWSLSFSLIWSTPAHYRNGGFHGFIFIFSAGHQTQGHMLHKWSWTLSQTEGSTLGVYVLIVCIYV